MSVLRGLGRWRWVLLALGLVLLLLVLAPGADCLFRDRWAVSEGPAPVAFRALPGRIGLTFTASYESEYRGEIRRLQFRGGSVVWTETLPPVVEHSAGSASAAGILPEIADLTVDLPYAVSADGRFAAVRATNEDALYRYHLDHRFAIPHDASVLVIVDLHAGRELARVDGGFRWHLEDLAWSPDGQYVAALRMEAEWGLCLREAYFFARGMPTQLLSYYLDIFDLEGRRIASKELLSRGKWFGAIVWTE